MSSSNLHSSRDASYDIGSEYCADSTTYTCDEESGSDDEDGILSDLLRKELLQTNRTTKGAKQMTAAEIADLLMKVRIEDDIHMSSVPNTVVGDNRDLISFSVISSPSTAEKANNKAKHPQTTLNSILEENGYKSDKVPFHDVPDGFFLCMTHENTEAYTKETLTAVRMKDVDKLKQYVSEGKNLQCCNKFGESIIASACRDGSTNVVNFLIDEANVSIQICDDYGRTPLHNACWTSKPNFDVICILIRKCVDLCIICDKRGHTPLDYVQKEQYENWNSFLLKNKDLIQPAIGERMS